MSLSALEETHRMVSAALADLKRKAFNEGVSLTLVARVPGNPHAHLVVTDDDLDAVIDVFNAEQGGNHG